MIRLVQSLAIWALVAVALGSVAAYELARNGVWTVLVAVYSVSLVTYSGYLLVLLAWHDLRPRCDPGYDGGLIAVLIPCYNEEPELFRRCLHSVHSAEGRLQVIVIDDGSVNGIGEQLPALAERYGFTLRVFLVNRGKRAALHHAVKDLLDPDVRYVVTIDSDTIVARDAFVRVCAPLTLPRVAAATGNVELLNERQNLLTRGVGAYYWIGLNINKQAQSVIRSVVCCSGCLAAYRADTLRAIIDEFAAQVFLGERCTHSEDRHLTNLVLREGLDVVYVPAAVSWTETPATLRGFLQQQLRWKRGYVRETLLTVGHGWRHKRLLWLQILLWELPAPYLALGIQVSFVTLAFSRPQLVLILVTAWLLLGLLRYAPLVLRAPSKLPGFLVYVVLYETALYWVNLWALLTVKNSSWVTRQHRGGQLTTPQSHALA